MNLQTDLAAGAKGGCSVPQMTGEQPALKISLQTGCSSETALHGCLLFFRTDL
jgi:hypothetical protein